MSEENMRRIVELEDMDGIVFPQTHIQAVINSSGTPLNEILENIQAGNVDLTEIRSAIAELQDQIFPLTSSLTLSSGGNAFEYTGQYIEGAFRYSISFKGEDKRPEIKTLKLTCSEGITDVSDISNIPTEILFSLPAPDNFSSTAVKNYSASLEITLKNGKTARPTCNFSQIAPSWVGWSEYSEVGDWMRKDKLNTLSKTPDMSKILKTNLSGTYSWNRLDQGKSFWIIVPQSSSFTGYNMAMANGFQVVMANLGTYSIGGVTYTCLRNDSGGLKQSIETGYKITLSNN